MYSHGSVLYIRYIWLVVGFLIFLAFGLGKDAVKMYKQALLSLGLGRCMPSLREGTSPRAGSATGTLSSFSSKAKLMFGRKSSRMSTSDKTWATGSNSSKATASCSDDTPISPKTTAFADHASEVPAFDIEKNTITLQPTRFQRLTGAFKPSKTRPSHAEASREQGMDLDILVNKDITISSTISAGERSPSLPPVDSQSRDEVHVRREVRQGSEAALP